MTIPCPACGGFGHVTQIDHTGYREVMCDTCDGTREVEATCGCCDGLLDDSGYCAACEESGLPDELKRTGTGWWL